MIEIISLTKEYALENTDSILTLECGLRELGIDPWDSDGLLRELPLKWKLSHVALMDGKIVGSCICSSRDGAVYVHRLLVDKAARLRGIGRSLLRHSLQEGVDAGLERIRWVTRIDNQEAVKCFDGLGFKRSDQLDMARPDGIYYVYDTEIRELMRII